MTTAVQKMIPSAVLARSPRVGQLCELGGNEFEIAFEQGKIVARVISLPQR
jgi:hypothetical protein